MYLDGDLDGDLTSHKKHHPSFKLLNCHFFINPSDLGRVINTSANPFNEIGVGKKKEYISMLKWHPSQEEDLNVSWQENQGNSSGRASG